MQRKALADFVRRLELALVPPTQEMPGLYGWEPLPLDQFLDGLDIASVTARGKFLDVGCGIGTKLVLANNDGWQVTGLDIRPEFLAEAAKLCPEAALIEADAREFNSYGDYDFIYCYRPLVDDEAEDRLEEQIVSQLKTGAWLFLPHRAWLPGTERSDLHWMGTPLWRKAW